MDVTDGLSSIPAVSKVSGHTFYHSIEHPLCFYTAARTAVSGVCLKGSPELLNHCLCLKIRDPPQLRLYLPVTVQLVFFPCNIRNSR